MDTVEAKTILAHADDILPHMRNANVFPDDWFDGRRSRDPHALSGTVIHTTVLDAPDHYGGTACAFLRDDHKCALQVAAEAAGHSAWHWKPFYCILHPLDLDTDGQITLDETELLLSEPASCLRAANAPVPLLDTFAEELRYLLGETRYAALKTKNSPPENG